MSYSIGFYVKVDGLPNKYVHFTEPHYSSVTYNYGKLFRACMDWDYSTYYMDENNISHPMYYKCDYVLERVEHGLCELLQRKNKDKYTALLPSNGWGDYGGAIEVLESIRSELYEIEENEEIPLTHVYMCWG